MVEQILAGSAASEKAIAAKTLEELSKHLPKDDADRRFFLTENPVVKLAQLSLEHIAEHGGKLDPSLIGMLSVNAKQESLEFSLLLRNPQPNHEDQRMDHALGADISSAFVDAILASGLVQLPVSVRGRGQ